MSAKLHAGDWVEVRSKEEILRTLDDKAQLDHMPFMPEMFALVGKRLRVVSSAHKTCDTISGTGGRSVTAAVHLEGVRCDGKAHDDCAAGCLIYWKDAWLKPAEGPSGPAAAPAPAAAASPSAAGGCTEERVNAAARAPGDGQGPTYVCQATEIVRASAPLSWWDVRQYVEDYRSGNVGAKQLAEGLAYSIAANSIRALRRRPRIQDAMIAAYDRVQAVRGGVPYPRRTGSIPVGQKTPAATLDLQPGDLVRVKSYEEILATLDESNKNRGLYFDAEHVPYCGTTRRVLARVKKIVDEKTGKMLDFRTAGIILEGVICQAHYSGCRMMCPRAIYPYWREVWLERVVDDRGSANPRS